MDLILIMMMLPNDIITRSIFHVVLAFLINQNFVVSQKAKFVKPSSVKTNNTVIQEDIP